MFVFMTEVTCRLKSDTSFEEAMCLSTWVISYLTLQHRHQQWPGELCSAQGDVWFVCFPNFPEMSQKTDRKGRWCISNTRERSSVLLVLNPLFQLLEQLGCCLPCLESNNQNKKRKGCSCAAMVGCNIFWVTSPSHITTSPGGLCFEHDIFSINGRCTAMGLTSGRHIISGVPDFGSSWRKQCADATSYLSMWIGRW